MAFPFGWTASAVAHGVDLARKLKADPRDIFALWYHESGGLNPRVHPFGDYYGLIGGSDSMVSPAIGTSWSNIVENGTIEQQIDAIAKLWGSLPNTWLGGESIDSRAAKIGTTPAAMIYALNFVPAYARNMQSADQVLVPGSDPYYAQNPAFDTNHKGYITIRDLENKIAAMRTQMAQSGTVGALYASIPSTISPVAWIKQHPILTAAGILLVAGGVTYYFKPELFRRIPVVGRLAAEENPVRRLSAGARRRRRASRAPGAGGGRVQTLLFPRSSFSPSSAKAWARKHGFRSGKIDVTDQYVRIRQLPPGGRMRTIQFQNTPVRAVVRFG